MTEEYLKNDHLTVSVKRGVAEEIKSAYRVFGWRLTEERGDKRYSDIVHMKFDRDHRIAGKDRLQLLQVRFDVAINFMGKAGGRMSLRALCAGIVLALVGAALIVGGALILANYTATALIVCGVVLISAGIAAFVLAALVARRLYMRDKRTYTGALAVIAENIRSTVKEASLITGILPEGSPAGDIAEKFPPQGDAQGSPQDVPVKLKPPHAAEAEDIRGRKEEHREGVDGN